MAEDPGNVVKIEFNTVELPPSVEIRESSVISGQAGAFSKTLIAKDTKFGPYKGEIINAGQKDYIDYRYAWEVFEKDSNDLRFTISALDPKSSNWMRHVNCARFYEEQNILSIQEEYSIYYVAMKNIKPGEELLTWFDPKLLKRTKRRLSKMGRKPVGYTIELVPWSDEKKFVPEIIDTKRKRKKKVLRDMISLDENPLVITRTLQSLSKIPCTPKQLAQSSFKGTSMNVGFKHSRAVSPASESLLSKAKKGSKPPSQNINVPPKTENKMNEYVTSKSSSETCKQQQEGTDKSKCASFDHASTAEASQKEARKVLSLGDVKATDKKVNKHVLLKKTPIKLGRARLQFSTHRGLLHVDTSVVKPVVVKQHEDGSTSVEDHDETYILNNIQLRPECDEKCPCLASNQRVKSSSSVTTKQDSFVIHFTLLPEHKSLSRDNKIIYRCDVCDGAYNHAFSLKRHYLSVHVNHRYLSRDDILSCQIETFHMDIDHQTEGSQKETDTLLKDQESTALKMQSAPPTTTDVSSSGQAEISDNPGKSVADECENNGKEDINSEAKEAVDIKQFTNVPSLKHLVQISLCKTKGVTERPCSPVSVENLSMTCDEVTNDSCVTDICVSSEGEESVQIDLPHQLDPGLDCVISEQNEEMSVAVFASQGSPCVHTDIEKPHGDTLEALTGQEAADCEADHMTASNSCSNTSENILDLNPYRLEQHDNNDDRNLLLNGEVSLDITDSADLISKSICEIHCGTSELCGDLLVKTTTDDLHGCANGEVDEKGVVEESRDLCHSHVKNRALTNHDEASADFPATLEEDTHTTAVHALSGYSTETENPDMKSAQTENSDMKSAQTENPDMKSTQTENSDMKSAQTENSDMKSAQTENSDMKSAQTENSDMKSAQTENSDMKSAETENYDMKSAQTENSDMKSAQTENSDMKSAETENYDMKSAQTENSDMKSAQTENSDMKSAQTENSDMKSAQTENSDMKSAETENSDMKSAQTENSDMKSAETENSDMKSVQTENSDMKSVQTENSDMKSVQTENSDMKSVQTENSDMKSVQTENSDMKSVQTENSDMKSVQTENSDMKSVQTENSDMKSAQTENSDMKSIQTENSDMKSAETENSDMKSAETENSDMKSAETENSDMKSAETENSDMKSAQTENSDMKSAETENSDMKSAETENSDMKSVQTENSDMKSVQTENSDMKSVQTENSDMKSVQTENSDMKSVQTENSDMKSAETENSDMKSIQTENSDMKSVQTENSDMKSVQTENSDMKSVQTESSDMKSAQTENSDMKSVQTESSDMKSAQTENSDMKSVQTENSDMKSVQTENSDMKSAQTENSDMKPVETAGSVLDLSRVECGSVQASDADSRGYMIPHCGTSLEVADSSQCLDHPSATASWPSTVLSEEFPAGMNAVSPVVDTSTTIGSCGLVSPVVNCIAFSSGKAEASEPLQNMDVLTSSIQTQGKQEPLDDHLADNFTVQTTVESSTATTMTTSTSVTKNPSAQKLIFVTNLVFPVVSPSHSQPQNPSSSAPQGSSPLANKTSQSTSVPLVVISQVPCGLTMQNATSAFLPSSNALKALQTMKNSFSVLNFGNSPPGLSLSVLPSGSKPSISPSACDKILLESSLALGMPAASTATTAPSSCPPSLPAPSTEKQLKPSLNLCAPFARISSLVLGGAHLPAPSPGSTQCTASPTVVPLSSISSLVSVNNNVTPVDGQPDDLYRCHMCVRVFKTLNELKLHIRNDPHRFKGGIKQYACQQCSMRFSNKNNLMRHNLMNHPESENYKFRCYTCGKGFMCETYLKMHARFHSGRNFPCKYGCKDVYFPNAAALVKHLRTQHPGLNLKEYLRNAKAGQAHGRKLSCLLRTTVEHKPSPGAEGRTLETSPGAEGRTLETSPGAVISTLPYSLQQPGVGFQAKRRHSKSSRTTFPDGENTGMADQECESTPDTEESPSNSEDSGRLRYACNVCLKRFRSHLHLLQHRTQQHGAGESVQEYLYQMSKDTLDEESDTEPLTLKFSPPPSPTTFFENVNKRGFENMTHYIDGNKESLKFWQKHLNFQGNSDPMLVSEAVKKLEWTLFNFPPCFEYKEDCTAFYDSATRPGTSPKLLASPAEGHKEKGTWRVQPGLDVRSGPEGAAANTLQQEPVKSCIEGAAKSILRFGDETCSQNVSDSLDAYEQGLVGSSKSHVSTSPSGIELHQSPDNLANTDSCQSINDAGQISLEQSHERSHMNHVAKNQEVKEGDTLSEMSSVEDVVPEEKVSGTVDTSITNKEVEAENHYICRHIVHELVNRVVLMQERTLDEQYNSYRPHSVLDGNSNLKACICEGEQSKSAVDESDSLPHVDVKIEIKKEIIIEDVQEMDLTSSEPLTVADMDLTSSEPLTVADTILQRFTECSVQDKLDLFKSQSVQGLNLALSEHNHRLFLRTGCTPRHKSLSHPKSQSLIGALDLHLVNGWMSSEMFDQVVAGGLKQNLSVVTKKALSLESLSLWPPNKLSDRHFDHALDTSLTNSDTSRHDHRRYSIWAGQVHQNFDNTSKREMFCQPVTEAVRKQEVMRERAQYNFEKSIRDNEMQGKHEKITQKMCFAEGLGLMSRKEFELSYHARRQQQCVIKAPEVWNNYENIWFGKKGNIAVVCSICHRHFSCWDLCLRHQLKKHPHIEPASLEMEKDNYVEDMYYYYPMPYGILAQTHLIPDNLPVPEVYVCVRCGFPFKNLNRLHAHMIICDPVEEQTSSSQNGGVKKVSYMKKKLLPMMDRRLHQQVEQPKAKMSKSKSGLDVSAAFAESKHSRSLPVNGKTNKPTQQTSDSKPMASAVQSHSSYPTPFSFYSSTKGKNFELLYNPQNHARRREMYKILDQHQCHGCNLKFNSLYMLEKHVNKCSGKDKLQNQKPLLSGIMPDDAALRKQHTCRYCGKRFTYIKGVDLHYKRICAVRKVKEEENQLTEEDLAHEEELKKIIEHIKWSKSLSKDSSDIIQGHVRVEEDGTLTPVVKHSQDSQGLKKKVKKKGSKWTTLKRHRPEDDLICASPVSGSAQSSPVMATENKKSVVDEKVADKTHTLDMAGKKRLTRSAGHEGLHRNSGISNMRHTSTDRDTIGKKSKTVSKPVVINSCSKNNSPDLPLTQSKIDGNCPSMKGKPKKMTYDGVIGIAESRQNKTSKNSVKNSRSSPCTRNKIASSMVPPSAASVAPCIKPPARKRGKPKRFDPSDMESSYKKKKKDEDIVLDQAKSDSGGRKKNTASETRQRAHLTAKASDVCRSSHVLRQTSSRSSTHSSASTPTSQQCVNKNVVTNKEDQSKLLEKMKKLKEAAKSESRKSDQKRKLSVSLFTNSANKKSDSGDKNEKKGDKSMNKVSSSSELFKHLTTSEQLLPGNSPQKAVSNRKRTASVDSAGNVNDSQASGKRLKITTQNRSPAKPALSTTGNATESPGSKVNTTAHKYRNKCVDRYKESDQEALVVRTSSSSSSSNVSQDSKGTLLKPTSPVSKQPTVTFKVVTLSPNGSNLLTYDSSADVPQSSLLLTKPGKVASQTSPSQQILKCLPQRPIQFVTKSSSLLPGTELQKANHEQDIKVISAENPGLSILRDVHKQAVSTLVLTEGDRIKKPISQVCNQVPISQKDVLCKASCSPDGKQGLGYHAVCRQETNEISPTLRDTEKQTSQTVGPNSQDKVIIQRVIDNYSRESQLIGDMCDGQIIISSPESSQKNSEIVPKLSPRHGIQKCSESDGAQLCYADQLFQKQTSAVGAIDENLSAGHGHVVVNNVSSLLSLTESQSPCQKRQTLSEQTQSEVCAIVQSLSQSHSTSSVCVKSSSLSALRVANSLPPANSHESLSTIIVPSTSVKVHVTVAHAVPTTSATRFTFPSRFRSPAKVVTVTGTVLPHLSQGSSGHSATRILKLGGVNIRNASSAQSQIPSITTQYKQTPNTTRVVPQIVSHKPLVLSAGQLPRLLTTGVHQQHPNTQQIIAPGALRQSMLNISANQTNCATQLLPGRCLSKTVSPQICIPQSSLVNNIVHVAQAPSAASIGTSVAVSSIKSRKTSNVSLVATVPPPASNQIMFSLDDGTTAMLDPDSLAQFLTVSPSLNKSELYSTASTPIALQEYTSPVVLNIAANQTNHQPVEEINWPANGSVDLTDVSDTLID